MALAVPEGCGPGSNLGRPDVWCSELDDLLQPSGYRQSLTV